MRNELTRETAHALMRELARSAPRRGSYRVYLIGGTTAVLSGWRAATVDADLYCERDEIFRDIQRIKDALQVNVELVRPEQSVPELAGSSERHVFVETIDRVSFYHYDPYAQVLSKVVRGLRRDMEDANHFLDSGMVDADKLRALVVAIPAPAYSRYPHLSKAAVDAAVNEFLDNRLKAAR